MPILLFPTLICALLLCMRHSPSRAPWCTAVSAANSPGDTSIQAHHRTLSLPFQLSCEAEKEESESFGSLSIPMIKDGELGLAPNKKVTKFSLYLQFCHRVFLGTRLHAGFKEADCYPLIRRFCFSITSSLTAVFVRCL